MPSAVLTVTMLASRTTLVTVFGSATAFQVPSKQSTRRFIQMSEINEQAPRAHAIVAANRRKAARYLPERASDTAASPPEGDENESHRASAILHKCGGDGRRRQARRLLHRRWHLR